MDEEASDLYAVLIEQQQYNPSQAVNVLYKFKYCTIDEAWKIAKLYHAKQGIYARQENKQYKSSNTNIGKTSGNYA